MILVNCVKIKNEQRTERKTMKTIDKMGMKLSYHDDHDTRYAHIPESDRWEYPDEITFGFLGGRIKRTKLLKDLTWADVPDGLSPYLVANDVPYTLGCYKV